MNYIFLLISFFLLVPTIFFLWNWICGPILIFGVFLFKLWIQIIIVINFLDWKKMNKNTQKNKDLFSLISLIKNLRSLKINNARQTIFSCQNCAKWKKNLKKGDTSFIFWDNCFRSWFRSRICYWKPSKSETSIFGEFWYF